MLLQGRSHDLRVRVHKISSMAFFAIKLEVQSMIEVYRVTQKEVVPGSLDPLGDYIPIVVILTVCSRGKTT